MSDKNSYRQQIVDYLQGKHAHVTFKEAVDDLTIEEVSKTVPELPHTIWELVEHIRITQRDIIDFSTSPDYKAPDWPDDYWPSNAAPENQQVWSECVTAVQQDQQQMNEMLLDEETNLLKPFPHGSGQTLFREAMLIIDHNAYHIGQIIQVRRLLGCW